MVLPARLFDKVSPEPMSGCWLWTGTVSNNGYGLLMVRRDIPGKWRQRKVLAHRAVYEASRDLIPNGLTLDHLCRNRLCVNPDHLEPVTLVENVMRGMSPLAIKARQTHCIHGHELRGVNLYVTRDGRRKCRACHRATERARWRRLHAKEAA